MLRLMIQSSCSLLDNEPSGLLQQKGIPNFELLSNDSGGGGVCHLVAGAVKKAAATSHPHWCSSVAQQGATDRPTWIKRAVELG